MKFFATRKAAVSWGVFVLAMLGVLLPSLALAQSANGAGPFTVQNSDLSKRVFLDYLFGPLTGAGPSPLTQVVSVLNSAVLFLGGIFMAYTIIAGTMSTAHDGEMLGKKWSSLWLPIRTTIGAAAVMPVIGGSWCAAQAIVVWLASLGIGIANAMWGQYIANGNVLADAMYNPPNMSTQVAQLFENMLLSNVCVQELQAEGQAINASSSRAVALGLVTNPSTVNYFPSQDSNGVVTISYGMDQLGDKAYCGAISFPTAVSSASGSSTGANGSGSSYVSSTGQALLNMPEVNSQLLPLQNQTILNAQSDLAALAKQIVTTGGAGNDTSLQQQVSDTINRLVTNYTTKVNAKAQQIYSQQNVVNQKFINTMNQDGWVMAGAYYMEISRAQDQISQAITTLPTTAASWNSILTADVQSGKADSHWWQRVWGSAPSQDLIDALGRATAMTLVANQQISGGVASMTNSNNIQGAGDTKSMADRLVSAFTSSRADGNMFTGGGTNDSGITQNPVIMAKNLGNSMVDWAWTALIAILALNAGGAIPFVGGALQAMGEYASGPFSLLWSSLIIPGATLAYYIPMVPYILWIGVILGWAVLLIEAVIAAPLWAVVHMAPDGDGVVGRGGQGYMLVLSLTLRPPLMVLGLVFAIALMTPIGYLINSTFGGAFMMAQGAGTSGLTGMVAGCVIYAGVMVSVIHKIFGLIHVIPDKILRWIGGDTGGLGDVAGHIEQGTGGKMAAGMGAVREGSQTMQNVLARADAGKARRLQEKTNTLLAGQRDVQVRGEEVSDANDVAASAFSDAMAGRGEGSSEAQFQYAMNEARSARATAVQNAVAQAQTMDNMKSGSRQEQKETSRFLDSYNAAAKANKTQPGAMADFIKSEATRAREFKQDPTNPVMPFHDSIIKAQENQERLQRAQEELSFASNPDIQSAKASQEDNWDQDIPPV